MSDRPSTIVDFKASGEAAYQQIFVRVASALPNRDPAISSVSAGLDDLLFAYQNCNVLDRHQDDFAD